MNRQSHDIIFTATPEMEYYVDFYYAGTINVWLTKTFYDFYSFKEFYNFMKAVKENRNSVLLWSQDDNSFDGFREIYLLVLYDNLSINSIATKIAKIVDPTTGKRVSLINA